MTTTQLQQQATTPKRNVSNLCYTPSPTNASFGYLSISTHRTALGTVTPPTPLSAKNAKDLTSAVHQERPVAVEKDVSVIGFIDWTAEGRWWIDSDAKWTGSVEYPVSNERSSIAREAEHRIKAELEAERTRRGLP